MHGFRFIVLRKRMLFERILWIMITGTSIAAALSLTWSSWTTILKEPRLTLADSPNYAIWNYPFPAVTICNYNTISKERAYQFARNVKNPGQFTVEELAWNLRLLYYLIDPNHPDIPQENFTRLQEVLDHNNVIIDKLIEYLSPSCKEMMQRCTWKGQQIPCDKLFEQIKTPEGFCCSFNYFGQKNHTFGGVNQRSYKIASQPRRVAATGYQTALEAVINCYPEDYFATPFASFGHRVIVHYPYNFPDGNALNMVQATNSVIFIGVKPILYVTDYKVDSMHTSKRKCFFQHEKELLNFKYTYYNCVSECRLNLTKELCYCTPFYYSFGKDIDELDSKICNLRDIPCLSQNSDVIHTSIPGKIRNADNVRGFKSDWLQKNTKCPCLPDCTYCSYSIEGSAGEFSKEYTTNRPTLYGGFTKFTNQSVIRIFFDDLVSTKYTTSVRFYWHTLLGFFGGLLALFTGFSIVSVIEVAFFLTIRPLLDLLVQTKLKNKKNRSEKVINLK